MFDKRKIGVFDSGLGGLTTVMELSRIMPHEDIVYFGDTGRVPYGTRSRETIEKYTLQDIRFLLSQDVKMIICACNTASTIITKQVLESVSVPLLEVISPAVTTATGVTKNNRIGIIGTPATVQSGAYDRRIKAIDSNFKTISQSCPLFVPLVENGFIERDNTVTQLVAEQYLSKAKEFEVDSLILGCTHYPIIKDIISDIMGKGVTLIDSGREVAEVAKKYLLANNQATDKTTNGSYNYFVSDGADSFSEAAAAISGDRLNAKSAVCIDIETY